MAKQSCVFLSRYPTLIWTESLHDRASHCHIRNFHRGAPLLNADVSRQFSILRRLDTCEAKHALACLTINCPRGFRKFTHRPAWIINMIANRRYLMKSYPGDGTIKVVLITAWQLSFGSLCKSWIINHTSTCRGHKSRAFWDPPAIT